jgi:NADP-dependent 3-hydroxy acid dehydrogenase YdfG
MNNHVDTNVIDRTLQADLAESSDSMDMMSEAMESPLAKPESSHFSGKAVIVTGGTTGIGRSLAKMLVEHGANVLIFGRHERELNDALNEIHSNGQGRIEGMIADQSDLKQVEQVFMTADEKIGGVEVLVNNASIGSGKLGETSLEDMKYALDVNVLGYMACCKLALDRMKDRGDGHIVNIGSMSADAEDGSSVYVATKSAVRGFSKSFAKEANQAGIRVTNIEPGSVGTDMSEVGPEEQHVKQSEGKMLMAEDIAQCVLYAVSQPARCDVAFVQIRPRIEDE